MRMKDPLRVSGRKHRILLLESVGDSEGSVYVQPGLKKLVLGLCYLMLRQDA